MPEISEDIWPNGSVCSHVHVHVGGGVLREYRYLPPGRSVLGNTLTEVRSKAAGRDPFLRRHSFVALRGDHSHSFFFYGIDFKATFELNLYKASQLKFAVRVRLISGTKSDWYCLQNCLTLRTVLRFLFVTG